MSSVEATAPSSGAADISTREQLTPASTPTHPQKLPNDRPYIVGPSKNNERSKPSAKPQHGNENQHYDHDTVLVLLAMMKEAGYGDHKHQKKPFKEVFIKATDLAKKTKGIERSKAWQKKFTLLKQEYSAFVVKFSESGRDGDDADLFDKPDFYEQMHEFEKSKARHNPPAVLCSESGSVVSEEPLTSSRKRVKLSHTALLESFIEEQGKRHEDIIAEIKKGNEEKAKMRCVM